MAKALKKPAAGGPAPGEVVSWDCPGVGVRFAKLREALREAGLKEDLARDLLPRHAFARAAKKLAEDRLIEPVTAAETSAEMVFQLTARSQDKDEIRYAADTKLFLDKKTGKIRGDRTELVERAQRMLNDAVDTRNGSDVTRIMQRVFDEKADLFPLRRAGGIYFVFAEHAPFVDKVQRFLVAVGGHFNRLPVVAGSGHVDAAIGEAVTVGLTSKAAEIEKAIAELSAESKESTKKRRIEEIETLKTKVEIYALYLDDRTYELEQLTKKLSEALTAKVEEIEAVPA